MRLAKKHGGTSIGQYEWVHDGDVVDVDDTVAAALLAAAPHEWAEADPEPAEPVKRGPGRPRKTQIITE